MCDRYTLHRISLADREFQVSRAAWSLQASYNIAPNHSVAVVRSAQAEREGVMMRWGLIPHFCCGEPPAYSTINARLEVVETVASYRGPWHRRQRCLQLASGFYEWHTDAAGRKVPYYIHLEDQATFAFAGLWDRSVRPDGSVVESVALVTVPGNELLREIHNCGSTPYRMPAILRKEDHEIWLTGTAEQARAALTPYAPERMVAYEVSGRINLTTHDDEQLLEPVGRPRRSS
jgi:putative SOS response-associated peptidase YedK